MIESIPATRNQGLDACRGGLLVCMVLVHVLSASGRAAQVNALHGFFGVFLISGGFVWLSGFVHSFREGESRPGTWLRALRVTLQLLLAMVAYGVLSSLLRHLLIRAEGGASACAARAGWIPPLRFEDLGILLPIALVTLAAPLAKVRRLPGAALVALLAVGSLLLPGATESVPHEGFAGAVLGVLARRSLTPFYTVTTFVALGLAGVLLGRTSLRRFLLQEPSRVAGLLGLAASLLLGVPQWSGAILDAAYRANALFGAAATLVYWSVAIILFLRGLAALATWEPARVALALFGKSSLFIFVLHDFLLEGDAFALAATGASKGLPVVLVLAAINLALLALAAWIIDRGESVRSLARAFLLETSSSRSRWGTAGTGAAAALAFAGILAVYTSNAFAHPRAEVLIDDFEAGDGCPRWWTFGALQFRRVRADAADQGAQVLDVSGRVQSGASSGTGLYIEPEIGERRTLRIDVRGYGPDSGRIRIELFDDDNGNWEIEKDPQTFDPLYDDRFILELPVDWLGWRQLTLPSSAFRLDNPGVGNGVFDPERDGTSGGLLEMQFLFAPASGRSGDVHVQLDNIRWTP